MGKALTCGELPTSTTGRGQPSMMCSADGEAHGVYSAERGDYFWAPKDSPVFCECGAPMVLARHVDYWEEA